MLLLLTGSRKNEVLSAKWNEFDFENNIWTKPQEKTKQKKTSRIPLNQNAIDILIKMKNDNEIVGDIIISKDYLFYNTKTQKPLGDIKRFFAEVMLLAGIKDLRIHDLRHTFASILVNSGVNLFTVGKLLGHSNSKTTERYSHLQNDTLKQVSEIVSNVIGGKNF